MSTKKSPKKATVKRQPKESTDPASIARSVIEAFIGEPLNIKKSSPKKTAKPKRKK